MSVFSDQKTFMTTSGQKASPKTADLYKRLVDEEVEELELAWRMYERHPEHTVPLTDVADACIDIIYVVIGLLHSLDLDPQELWDEVQRSNMSKFVLEPCIFCGTKGCEQCNGQGEFYKAIKREDGKILKPSTYFKPDLISLIHKRLEQR